MKEKKFLFSVYNLLTPEFKDNEIEKFLLHSSNAGGWGIRIMSMMSLADNKYWSFSPWTPDFKAFNENWWARLERIVNLSKRYDLEVIFCLWVSQKNPLDAFVFAIPGEIEKEFWQKFTSGNFFEAWELIKPYRNAQLVFLYNFINQLRVRGYSEKIHYWELINEAGDLYLAFIPLLASEVRSKLGGIIIHSGEAPGTLAQFYDIYSPHTWGANLLKQLSPSGFENQAEIQYLSNLQNIYGKEIMPSSDGCQPDFYNPETFEKTLLAMEERGYEKYDIDIGWFNVSDALESVDLKVAYDFTDYYIEKSGYYLQNYLQFDCHPYKKIVCENQFEPLCLYSGHLRQYVWVCKKVEPPPTPKKPCSWKWYQFTFARLWACIKYFLGVK